MFSRQMTIAGFDPELAASMAVALTNAGLMSRASEVLEDARAVLSANPGAPLLAVMVEQGRLQFNFTIQILQIRFSAFLAFGDDLVAGTVVANRTAKWNVNVKRERFGYRFLVALSCPVAIVQFGYGVVEFGCRRIRGIARTGSVVASNQVFLK